MTTTNEDTATETKQLAVRLPLALIERIEKHVRRMKVANRWMLVTRADAIRSLLDDALTATEARGAPEANA